MPAPTDVDGRPRTILPAPSAAIPTALDPSAFLLSLQPATALSSPHDSPNGASAAPGPSSARPSPVKKIKIKPPEDNAKSAHPQALRIQKILKSTNESWSTSREALFVIAVAAEEFVKRLTKESLDDLPDNNPHELTQLDLANLAAAKRRLIFLREAIPKPISLEEALKRREVRLKEIEQGNFGLPDTPPTKAGLKTAATAPPMTKPRAGYGTKSKSTRATPAQTRSNSTPDLKAAAAAGPSTGGANGHMPHPLKAPNANHFTQPAHPMIRLPPGGYYPGLNPAQAGSSSAAVAAVAAAATAGGSSSQTTAPSRGRTIYSSRNVDPSIH